VFNGWGSRSNTLCQSVHFFKRTILWPKGRQRMRYDRSAVVHDAWTSLAASGICSVPYPSDESNSPQLQIHPARPIPPYNSRISVRLPFPSRPSAVLCRLLRTHQRSPSPRPRVAPMRALILLADGFDDLTLFLPW
jgi:hypothetical protein